MPIEIKVGLPTITISQGRTFMVATQAGEIFAHTDQGVYALDTRFLSFYRLYINREPLQVVNSSQLSFYASRFHLTNPHIETDGGVLDAQTLRITLNRIMSEGIHEDIDIANYTGKSVHCASGAKATIRGGKSVKSRPTKEPRRRTAFKSWMSQI